MEKNGGKIKKKTEYDYIYKTGKKIHSKYVIVFIKQNSFPFNRFGIVTSKKIGKAVVRNKVRRQIRAIMKKYLGKIKTHYDIVIVTRYNIKDSSFQILERDLINVFRKAGLY